MAPPDKSSVMDKHIDFLLGLSSKDNTNLHDAHRVSELPFFGFLAIDLAFACNHPSTTIPPPDHTPKCIRHVIYSRVDGCGIDISL